jgi:hypothetical protein
LEAEFKVKKQVSQFKIPSNLSFLEDQGYFFSIAKQILDHTWLCGNAVVQKLLSQTFDGFSLHPSTGLQSDSLQSGLIYCFAFELTLELGHMVSSFPITASKPQ